MLWNPCFFTTSQKKLLEPGPRGTPGGEAAQKAVCPRNKPIRPHPVTKCTVKHVSNQSVPSEQLKHALNAWKQLKTSAKRAKTVHLTRKMAKARQPIALSLETLSNQSMNESKSSTISRFTGLSSVYPQLHNRDTFSVLNSFYIWCFAIKNKQVNPHNPNPGQLNSENVISRLSFSSSYPILSLRFHNRDRFSVHQFTQSIGFRQETIDQPHRTRIQDDWALKTRNRQSKMHELNLGQSSILAVLPHLAASSWAGNLGGPVKMIFFKNRSRKMLFE